ncbi:MAG: helix-turn-helix transcriptional regulator [Hyphomicrobiaceae bacterium]
MHAETTTVDPLAHLRFLTIDKVCELTTYTPQHIYRLERAGNFPNRVRLGANRVAWKLAEIEDWFAKRPVVRPAKA